MSRFERLFAGAPWESRVGCRRASRAALVGSRMPIEHEGGAVVCARREIESS